jgi:hypothetical protein
MFALAAILVLHDGRPNRKRTIEVLGPVLLIE